MPTGLSPAAGGIERLAAGRASREDVPYTGTFCGEAAGVCLLGEPVVNPESAFLVAGSVCVVGQRGAVGSSLWEVECGGIAATGWRGELFSPISEF